MDLYPLVSVITPCYNGSVYLADCIESVIAQSFGDWEMLIVDDCSTDDSARIIKEYALQDSRIKYLRTEKPSASPSEPRNIGIKQAKGKYIAFLDCDDLWLPDKLEEQYRFAVANGYDFVFSDYEKVNSCGSRSQRVVKARPEVTYWDVLESNDIPCLTVMVSHNVVGDIRFRSIPKEDWGFWMEILRRGQVAYNTGIVHALYRVSPSSRSSNKFAMVRNQWFVLRKVEKVKIIPALYFMLIYLIQGFYKFIK